MAAAIKPVVLDVTLPKLEEAILNPAYKKLLNAVPGAPLEAESADAWPDEAKRRFYYVRVGAESLVKRPETEE